MTMETDGVAGGHRTDRRRFIHAALGGAVGWTAAGLFPRVGRGEEPAAAPPASAGGGASAAGSRPNIVVVLADDQGWRDASYQGSPELRTPNLDDLAAHGVRFDHFYAAQQMCSPGRFALLTGRAPFRVGLHHLGRMRPQEITIAKALKTAGYNTAHFGKWHLGDGATYPLRMGFDVTYYSPNYFDTGDSLTVNETDEKVEVKGDSSVFTMDLALDWIRKQAKDGSPFFVYVCFGSPHLPHRGAEEFKALYPNAGSRADFLAEVAGVDAAVGKLRAALRELGIADNTLLWFTSDNGGITPNSKDPAGLGKMDVGARTISCLEWPARVPRPVRTSVPGVHMDIYPTILDLAAVKMPGQPPLDGISLMPLLDGRMKERPKPMGFMLWNGKKPGGFDAVDFAAETQGVWIDGPYKLIVTPDGVSSRRGAEAVPTALHHLYDDPEEKINLVDRLPDVVARMRADLAAWQRSCRDSYKGKDYGRP
jgi:arylsulfatase A-like enzyme